MAFGILLCGLFQAVDLAAQSRTTASVRGRVTTAEGAPLPEAAVMVRHEGTGAVRQSLTGSEGQFSIPLLQPGGPYTVTVSHLAFTDETRTQIMLQVGERRDVSVVMSERAIEVEGLTVAVERTEVFNPSQVGPAMRLDEVQLEAVPIISRNVMELAVLSPMVRTTSDGGFSVLGQNDRYNAILVDGVSTKDVFGLTASGVPGGQAGARLIPIDAVQQYEVLVAPFDVRLSSFTGGVLNAVTRSGTNDWRVKASAIHRNEHLIGDLTLPTGPVDASGVDRSLLGFSVGGPLVRDKAHIFVTGELEERSQPPTGFNLERDDPALVRITPERLSELTDFFATSYGVEGGLGGPFPLDSRLGNVFGRVDWDFGGGTRLTVRNILSQAENDESPNRAQFEPYELSSNAVLRKSVNNTTSLQLFSELGGGGANELTVAVQRTTDETDVQSTYPQVGVDLVSSVAGAAFQREVRMGSQYFAHENNLEQMNFRITDALSIVNDSSTYIFGATAAYYTFDHRFLPGSKGDYFYANMDDVVADVPYRFQRNMLLPGQDPEVAFEVVEWGLFFQNQIDAKEGVTLRIGARVDVPYALDNPEANLEILDRFGATTSNVPSGQFLFSPRIGFNVLTGDRRRTQIRGGAGVFSGQIPFVWLSNAFHNNGQRSVIRVCEGRTNVDDESGPNAPGFRTDGLPDGCVRQGPNGLVPAAWDEELRTIVMFDKDFKYPQELRATVVVDQELSETTTISLSGMFTHAIHQTVLEDLNIGSPSGSTGPLEGYGGGDRRIFGSQSADGFDRNPEYPKYTQVLVATNESRDFAFNVGAELRGSFADRFRYQVGYDYGRSFDQMSFAYNDMVSNFGFRPTSTDPNESQLRPSDFDRPHKIVVSLFGAPFPGLPRTEISLLYTGQSGAPFSYVYRGDLNGDGYPGLGNAFDRNNDLVFVPDTVTQLPAGPATWQVLSHAMENDGCLANNRGRILERNACRAPFQHRLDVRLSHTMSLGSADVRFEADVINFLNLLNERWGNIQTVRSTVSLIEPTGRVGGGLGTSTGELRSQWAGGVLPSRDQEGRLTSSAPWTVLSPDSQWQAQFGVSVTFDRGR